MVNRAYSIQDRTQKVSCRDVLQDAPRVVSCPSGTLTILPLDKVSTVQLILHVPPSCYPAAFRPASLQVLVVIAILLIPCIPSSCDPRPPHSALAADPSLFGGPACPARPVILQSCIVTSCSPLCQQSWRSCWSSAPRRPAVLLSPQLQASKAGHHSNPGDPAHPIIL